MVTLALLMDKETKEIVDSFYVSGEGIYTFSDLSIEYGKTIETQGTTGNKPISYVTALALAKGGFKIHVDQRFADVKKKIAIWESLAGSRKLYYFMVGGKFVLFNPIVIESVTVSNIKISGKGIWLSADIDVRFQEYAGDTTHNTIGILQKRLEDYS